MKLKLIKTKDLAEIFQSLDIKFSFVNTNDEQVTVPAKCRDFLGDCIWSRKKEQPVSIYGFQYDFIKSPYDLETLRLSIKFPDVSSKVNFENNIETLRKLEDLYNIPRTLLIYPEDTKDTIVIEASPLWQEAPWKLALYTYYIKVLSYKDRTLLQTPEKEYNVILTEKNEQLLWSKLQQPTKYIAPSIYIQHNSTGFVSLLKKTCEPKLWEEVLGEEQ